MIIGMSWDRRGQVMHQLTELTVEIKYAEDGLTDAYQQRLRLLREARALDPPVLQRELADVCGVSGPAITQQLKKPLT